MKKILPTLMLVFAGASMQTQAAPEEAGGNEMEEVKAQTTPSPVRMNPDKLAGVDLTAGEPFIAPEDLLEGSHRPRGDSLYWGKELVVEVFEDDPATHAIAEPFPVDEYVMVLSGKLILTDADGQVQEFVAGDSLMVPKGFTGTWQMLGNYRELIVVERESYENAFKAAEAGGSAKEEVKVQTAPSPGENESRQTRRCRSLGRRALHRSRGHSRRKSPTARRISLFGQRADRRNLRR